MPLIGMELDQDATEKLGKAVLRLVSPGGPLGVLLPKIGKIVDQFVGLCHGVPVYDKVCSAVHSFTVELIRRGSRVLAEKLDRIDLCSPKMFALDTLPGDIVRVVTDVPKYAVLQSSLVSSIRSIYGLVDTSMFTDNIVVLNKDSVAYKKLVALNAAWVRLRSVVEHALSYTLMPGSLVARNLVVSASPVGDKWSLVAAFPALEAAAGASVPMVALWLSALPVAYVSSVDGYFPLDVDHSSHVAVPRVEFRVCSGGRCVDAESGPRSASVTPGSGFVKVYARSVSSPEAVAVVAAQAVVAPADIPTSVSLCLGERDYVSLRIYAPSRLRVRGLVSVDEQVEPGEARIRIPYRAALEKPSGVLDVMVESLSALRLPTGEVSGVSVTHSGGTAYATLVPVTTSFTPAIRGTVRLSLAAPKLITGFNAPKHLEPMQTGTASVTAMNAGTCVGVFAASIDGSSARRRLRPGEELTVSRRITMRGNDIAVTAEAELIIPGGKVSRRYTATIRLANAVVLSGSGLYVRGGSEENMIRIAVAGVAVKPLVETSVSTVLPLPAFATSLTVKPYQEIHVASVTMPQALVVKAEKPVWLVVYGDPVEKKTSIVWTSNPAAKPLASVLEDMLARAG